MGVISAFEGAGTITFNNITSSSIGIYVERFPDHAFPERNYTIASIPGRNGDVVIDTGSYKNVDRVYDLVIASDVTDGTGFQGVASALNGWLHQGSGYLRLEDSYEPDVYRMAMYRESNTIRNILLQGGRASVAFNCKPQCFLKSGEVSTRLTKSGTGTSATYTGTFVNPTMYPAYPVIFIKWSESASETVSIAVGARTWQLVGSHGAGTSFVDSQLRDCYTKNGANVNSHLRFPENYYEFPILQPMSSTTIQITGSEYIDDSADTGTTKRGVQVIPNWWRL